VQTHLDCFGDIRLPCAGEEGFDYHVAVGLAVEVDIGFAFKALPKGAPESVARVDVGGDRINLADNFVIIFRDLPKCQYFKVSQDQLKEERKTNIVDLQRRFL
jgi:hypothetical protein